jgi:hypothetical protein
MDFDIFFSLLAHEKPDFLEFQFENLKSFLQYKKVLIVIHFNESFWNESSEVLEQICKNYCTDQMKVIINPNHFKTKWGSSPLLDGWILNLQIALDLGFTFKYFTFYSSTELLIRSGFIEFLDSLGPFDMLEYNYKNQSNANFRDIPSKPNDTGLFKFIKEHRIEPFVGFDWGRIITYETTLWLYMAMTAYWSFPITPPFYDYSISEWTVSTVLSVKPGLKVLDTIKISELFNRYPSGKDSLFFYKSCQREFYHPALSRIIKEQIWNSKVPKVPSFYCLFLGTDYSKNVDSVPAIRIFEDIHTTYTIFQNCNFEVKVPSQENPFIAAIQYLVDSNVISNDHWFILIRDFHSLGKNTLAKLKQLTVEFEDTPIDILWLSSNKKKDLCMIRREALLKGFDESVHQCCYEKNASLNENGKLYFESIDLETST